MSEAPADDRYGQPWTERESVLALNLYCQIPFAKTKAQTPAVRTLAAHLGRTPASVARKLGNFGSFDPALAQRGVVGLTNSSKADREIWGRYTGRWDALVDDAHALWDGASDSFRAVPAPEEPGLGVGEAPQGPSETRRLASVRRHQAFFRRAVLASYDSACCACGLDVPALLNASHIVPWSSDESLRADPTNGLCLCALHDRAFDRGLLALSDEGTFLVSDELKRSRSEAVSLFATSVEGAPLRAPRRFSPNPHGLTWHRENVFRHTSSSASP